MCQLVDNGVVPANINSALRDGRTPFTRKEILKLHTRFQALSAQGFHSLTAKEVMNIEEMRANPFAPRICELFSGGFQETCTAKYKHKPSAGSGPFRSTRCVSRL